MPRNPDKLDYSGGLPAHFKAFVVIEDPRTGGNKMHHFGEVLFMSVSAMLCGMNGFAEIAEFCGLQQDWLRKWISLPNGVPTGQTFSNIFAIINPDLFNRCLAEHVSALHPALLAGVIAVDGKRLRGSGGPDTEGCHAVSAWSARCGVTLAQEYVADKSNEITAIPRLLELLDLHGQIVTIDAMGTHTHIAAAIVEGGGDYLLALKGNQGNLHQAVCDEFHFATRQLDLGTAEGWSHDRRRDRSHGRDIRRTLVATTRLDFLDAEIRERWQGLASIIMVENETRVPGEKKMRRETRYFISSLKCGAAEFQDHVRTHWSIENQCHWVLDTLFREDHNQTWVGNAAKNLGALRRIVLNLLKMDPTGSKKSLPMKRLNALVNPAYREKLLSLA